MNPALDGAVGASDTPIVDRCTGIGTWIRSTGDVAEWARAIERNARQLKRQLGDARAFGNPTAILHEAELAVLALLDEEDTGPMVRTLRRPWQQLVASGTPRRALSMRAKSAFDAADAALKLHPVAITLARAVAELRERFGADLPTLLEEHLLRARLTDDSIRRLRKVQSAEVAHQRVSRVADILDRYLRVVPSANPDEAAALDSAASRGDLTLRELRAAYEIAKRERRALEMPSRVDVDARLLSRDAVEAQARQTLDVGVSGPEAQVLEELARLALDPEAGAFRGGLDIPVWTGMFAAGHNAAFPKSGRYGWRPPSGALGTERVVAATDHNVAEAPGVWYAVPVIRDYVYLTREHPSSIRVWSRGLRVGAPIECVLSTETYTMDHPARALHDIPAFFDDLDLERSAWYRTQKRARITVLFADGDGWFGTITDRGLLKKTDQLPWRDERESDDSVRILLESRREAARPSDSPLASARASDVVHPVGVVSAFLGVENRWVRTPYSDHRKALIRVSSAKTAPEKTSIAREKDFFRQVESEAATRTTFVAPRVLHYLTAATIPRGTTAWPVYAVPFGLTVDAVPAIDLWMRRSSDSIAETLRSVARALLVLHASGYCLGICHSACFAFTARWPRLDQPPVPDVTLFRAPAVTRFGQTFSVLPVCEPGDYYAYIGIDAVPAVVRSRALAEPHVDAFAFGAFMLDLIATEKLPARDDRSWASLPGVVERVASTHFRFPLLASSLAVRLATSGGASGLWDALRHIATAQKLDFQALGLAI